MRYFSLKAGSEDVKAAAIQVNPKAESGRRIEDLTGCYEFGLVARDEGDDYYGFGPDKRAGMIEGVGATLRVSEEGDAEIIGNDSRFFLEEITEREALSLAKQANNWRLMQGYVESDTHVGDRVDLTEVVYRLNEGFKPN